MKDLEFNKIFASILVAGIIAMLAGFVAELAVHDAELEKDAVAIEGAASVGGAVAKEDKPEPVLHLVATIDPAEGAKVAKVCMSCHSFEAGGGNGIGPNLHDVLGRKKDVVAGFDYSGALLAQGGDVWTYEELNKFIYKPKKYAPGTKMNFIGLKKAEDRAAILAYLHSLNGGALPSDAEIAKEKADLAPAEEEAAAPAEGEAAAPATEAPSEAPAQ
ncbi:MAG: cytochrome c family protein [Pseudobdellovibrionaceae bacterium]